MPLATAKRSYNIATATTTTTTKSANDNQLCTTVKEMLTMSLQLLPLSELIPSWKRDAYESNNPARAFISYSHCDNEWELRMANGSLIETHRHKDELIVELEIWKGVWNKKWGII